jgi:putative addiction module killer protein
MYPGGYALGKKTMADDGCPRQLRIEFRGEVLEFELSERSSLAVVETDAYSDWIDAIADRPTHARITREVDKIRRGLIADWKELDGIFEKRMDYGPGYRVYYARLGSVVVVLLGGGDKGSQKTDIAKARRLWGELRDEIEEV